VKLDATDDAYDVLADEYAERYSARCSDREHPPLPPDVLVLDRKTFEDKLSNYPVIDTSALSVPTGTASTIEFNTALPGNVRIHPRSDAPAGNIKNLIDQFSGRILFTAESAGRRETLIDQLQGFSIRPVTNHQ